MTEEELEGTAMKQDTNKTRNKEIDIDRRNYLKKILVFLVGIFSLAFFTKTVKALIFGSNPDNIVNQVKIADANNNVITSATRGSEQALSVQLVDSSGNQVTSFSGKFNSYQ